MYEAIEQTLQASPWATVEQYVDDIVIQTIGQELEATVEQHVQATEGFIKKVEGLRCRVSTKSQGLASAERLKKRLDGKIKRRGLPLKMVDKAVDLGCDTSAGAGRWIPKEAQEAWAGSPEVEENNQDGKEEQRSPQALRKRSSPGGHLQRGNHGHGEVRLGQAENRSSGGNRVQPGREVRHHVAENLGHP